MTGKLHIAPLTMETPTKDRPEEAPATPEAVKVEPQLAGGESWGDGLEAIKSNNIVVGLNLIQPAESQACRPARASDEDLNESREADVVVEAPLGPLLFRGKMPTSRVLCDRAGSKVCVGKSRGKKCVVKTFSPKTAAAGCRELVLLKAAQGPRIVQLLGAAFAQTQPTIVMEFCSRGTLDDAVRNWLDVAGARRVAAHVAEALAHLHSLRPAIVHRDVKPKNVLICRDGSAKLADFGLARPFPGRTANDQYVMTGETGTVRWMAPEAFRGDPYSLKVDIYSWAMVAWFALCGQAPYAEKTLKDLRRTHLELHDRPPLKGRPTNSGVASLLSLAWAEAPGDRPEAASLSRALTPFSVRRRRLLPFW